MPVKRTPLDRFDQKEQEIFELKDMEPRYHDPKRIARQIATAEKEKAKIFNAMTPEDQAAAVAITLGKVREYPSGLI